MAHKKVNVKKPVRKEAAKGSKTTEKQKIEARFSGTIFDDVCRKPYASVYYTGDK